MDTASQLHGSHGHIALEQMCGPTRHQVKAFILKLMPVLFDAKTMQPRDLDTVCLRHGFTEAACLQLSSSMATLESALESAQDQASRLDLEPLASQLRSAASTLRMSATGSHEAVQPIALRLEAAAGDLLQVGQEVYCRTPSAAAHDGLGLDRGRQRHWPQHKSPGIIQSDVAMQS